MVECTQNADVFAEVSGMLNACATNLIKISQDLRLMGSGPSAGFGELSLPPMQAGSSIMPGKVNPVIPEAVIQAAVMVTANHIAITQSVSMGNLELNAFMPLIADRLLDSLDLLSHAAEMLHKRCINGLTVNTDGCKMHIDNATATVTALVDRLGYDNADKISKIMQATGKTTREVVVENKFLTEDEYNQLTSSAAVMSLGSKGN
jgi:aspartate ammonia-lyase